jgi:cytochrome c-type biogenesis protein CcmE
MLLSLTLALTLAAASPAPALATTPTKIADILANPTSFDGQHLSVAGTVAQLAAKTSRRGNDYTTFDLCDTTCIHVYSYGHPKLANGQALTVTGKFFADKHVGSADFKNELDADEDSL